MPTRPRPLPDFVDPVQFEADLKAAIIDDGIIASIHQRKVLDQMNRLVHRKNHKERAKQIAKEIARLKLNLRRWYSMQTTHYNNRGNLRLSLRWDHKIAAREVAIRNRMINDLWCKASRELRRKTIKPPQFKDQDPFRPTTETKTEIQ